MERTLRLCFAGAASWSGGSDEEPVAGACMERCATACPVASSAVWWWRVPSDEIALRREVRAHTAQAEARGGSTMCGPNTCGASTACGHVGSGHAAARDICSNLNKFALTGDFGRSNGG
mmetsp:Transcript_90861/g.272842  ORF Transcript_90861/g.272842 Transcript_90861/m.272842 type:complete len:119 (-) Transcript_90861:86-442(-)